MPMLRTAPRWLTIASLFTALQVALPAQADEWRTRSGSESSCGARAGINGQSVKLNAKITAETLAGNYNPRFDFDLRLGLIQ